MASSSSSFSPTFLEYRLSVESFRKECEKADIFNADLPSLNKAISSYSFQYALQAINDLPKSGTESLDLSIEKVNALWASFREVIDKVITDKNEFLLGLFKHLFFYMALRKEWKKNSPIPIAPAKDFTEVLLNHCIALDVLRQEYFKADIFNADLAALNQMKRTKSFRDAVIAVKGLPKTGCKCLDGAIAKVNRLWWDFKQKLGKPIKDKDRFLIRIFRHFFYVVDLTEKFEGFCKQQETKEDF
ncbi:MAG: hypothetical protein K1X28_00255 [Parachlamydiales bacterium]|nr:hypothetical protein [Parachlamydiales bacterium]